MKICVYAICKNEEAFVEHWLYSAEEADAIYINDTGSTDNTVELLKKHPKVTLIQGKASGENFRFDHAWNEVLDIIPEDMDFCIRLDLDEILTAGWRRSLESFLKDKVLEPNVAYTLQAQYIDFQKEPPRSSKKELNPDFLRTTLLGYAYTKKARYFRAIHEDLTFKGLKPHVFTLPEGTILKIHLPKKINRQAKRLLYIKLSLEDCKEYPSYHSIVVALMSFWGIGNEIDSLIKQNGKSSKEELLISFIQKALKEPIQSQKAWIINHYGEFYEQRFPVNPLFCLFSFYILSSYLGLPFNKEEIKEKIIRSHKNSLFLNQRDLYYFCSFIVNFKNEKKLMLEQLISFLDPELKSIFLELIEKYYKKV